VVQLFMFFTGMVPRQAIDSG